MGTNDDSEEDKDSVVDSTVDDGVEVVSGTFTKMVMVAPSVSFQGRVVTSVVVPVHVEVVTTSAIPLPLAFRPL